MPAYSSASEMGMERRGSMLRRSRSPTKLSSAMTSEKEMGKKPTIIREKGTSLPMMTLAFWSTPQMTATFAASSEVTVISSGKISVSKTMGVTMRQSRRLSRTSRRVMIMVLESTLSPPRCAGTPPPGCAGPR